MFIFVNGEWREIPRDTLIEQGMTRHDVVQTIEHKRPSLIYLTFYKPVGRYIEYARRSWESNKYYPVLEADAYLLKYEPEYQSIQVKIDKPSSFKGDKYMSINLDNIKVLAYLR